jgi:hypothetical protein
LNSSSCRLQHLGGGPALHVVAAVAPTGVVAIEEVSQDPIEVCHAVESPAVERRPVALLQDRAVEPLDDRVVVRRTRRGPVVGELQLLDGGAEVPSDELRAVEFLTGVKPQRPP